MQAHHPYALRARLSPLLLLCALAASACEDEAAQKDGANNASNNAANNNPNNEANNQGNNADPCVADPDAPGCQENNNPNNAANNNPNNQGNNANNNPPACDPPCAPDETCEEGACVPPPPPDGDLDGVPDAEDNCLAAPNEDQADGDEDGLGDVCDACPMLADPENDPEACMFVAEQEPNDDALQGEGWELPLRIQGVVGEPVDGLPDLDFYSLEFTGGQALRVELDYSSGSFFGALIVFGYDFENGEYFRVLTGVDFGRGNAREMFITVPGRYSFVVSDLRNLIEDPDASGGDDFQYELTVTEFDPDPEPTGDLPFNASVPFDELLHLWRFPASAQPFVLARASGQSFDQNALILPSIIIYDPQTKQILLETVNEDIDPLDNSVNAQALTPGDGELWFILDTLQGFGPNATTVSLTPGEAGRELEPNQSYEQATPVEAPGRAEGQIDTPEAQGDRLVADVDYFTFYATEGQLLTIWLEKAVPNNDFDAAMDIGFVGEFNFFETIYVVRDQSEETTDIRLDFLPPGTGIYFLAVREQANFAVGPDEDPVGGPDYGYILRFEAGEPEITGDLPLPGAVDGALPAPGRQALYRVAAPVGLVDLSLTPTGALNPRLHAFDADTGAYLGGEFDILQILNLAPRDVLVQVADFQGRGGPDQSFSLAAASRAIEEADGFPFTAEGTLSADGQANLYILHLPADTLIDIRIEYAGSDIGFPELALVTPDDLVNPILNSYNRSLQLRFDAPTEILLRVRDLFGRVDGDGDYRLGVQVIESSPLGALPVSQEGALPQNLEADWFTLDYTQGQRLLFQVAPQNGLQPQLSILDLTGRDPQLLRSTSESQHLFTSTRDAQLLIGVSDSQNRGMEGFAYTLGISELAPEIATLPFSADDNIATPGQKHFYEFDAAQGDLLRVLLARPVGSDLQPRLTLYRADNLQFITQVYNEPLMLFTIAQDGRYLLELADILNGGGGDTFDFTIHLETIIPAPLAVPDAQEGTLEVDSPIDTYELTAPEGQLILITLDADMSWSPLIEWRLDGTFERAVTAERSFLFVAPREGRYLFSVYDAQGLGGPSFTYTLSLAPFEIAPENTRDEAEPNNDATSTDAITGDAAAIQGAFAIDGMGIPDMDWFPIELSAGDRLTALTTYGLSGIDNDTYLALRGPSADGPILSTDDDGGPGAFSRLPTFTAPQDGTYYLVVTPFDASQGDYKLLVQVTRAEP